MPVHRKRGHQSFGLLLAVSGLLVLSPPSCRDSTAPFDRGPLSVGGVYVAMSREEFDLCGGGTVPDVFTLHITVQHEPGNQAIVVIVGASTPMSGEVSRNGDFHASVLEPVPTPNGTPSDFDLPKILRGRFTRTGFTATYNTSGLAYGEPCMDQWRVEAQKDGPANIIPA